MFNPTDTSKKVEFNIGFSYKKLYLAGMDEMGRKEIEPKITVDRKKIVTLLLEL